MFNSDIYKRKQQSAKKTLQHQKTLVLETFKRALCTHHQPDVKIVLLIGLNISYGFQT